MNTEQVGVLLVSTINTTSNETVKTISNPNIGKLCTQVCHYICAHCVYETKGQSCVDSYIQNIKRKLS